jgi:arsenate reductase-like glutaredoxin family protein
MSSVPGQIEVQILGTKKHSDTRKAERFFKERRIKVHFMDFAIRAPSLGELRRFSQKYGVEKLIDRDGKRFAEMGLGPSRYGEEKWLTLLSEEPLLLVQPLVRFQQKVTVGLAEATWKEWVGR